MKKAINHRIMRSNNKRQIMELIRKNGSLTKKEIAQQLNVSITTVATFITELINESRIIPSGNAESTGGRKSELYHLNSDSLYVIGVDLQVDRFIILLINLQGQILRTEEVKYAGTDEWQAASILYQTILRISDSTRTPISKIAGIGVGVPGIVNHQTGIIEFAPNLGWKNVNLASLIPVDIPVIVENEANAAAIGESNFGAAQGRANVIYISVGLGIGTGLIFNNDLYSGHNFLAGEFGHMTIIPNGLPCRCGKKGCWEVYASNSAALNLYHHYSKTTLEAYEDLLTAYFQNDPIATRVINETTDYLGLGIANLINGLNPEMIIIGGKITEAESSIQYRLLREVKEHCFEYSYRDVEIKFSRLKNKATALGVGGLMIDYLLDTQINKSNISERS
ncbi:MAG: ROK family protein [Bacillota bacterium]